MKILLSITVLLLLVQFAAQAQVLKAASLNDSIEAKENEVRKRAYYKEFMKSDWANLNKYSDENLKLWSPGSHEKRVIFMGNSITENWIRICPDFFAGKSYINRGINGQTTPQMLLRFRPDVINLKPKVVVILAGTNDIAGNTGPASLEMIIGNIYSMAELAKANNIKVILCSILPVYDYPWNRGLKPYEKIPVLNKWMKDYAKKNHMIYLDYYSAMVDDRPGLKLEYSSDGVHPNKLGYGVMAKLADLAISKALRKVK